MEIHNNICAILAVIWIQILIELIASLRLNNTWFIAEKLTLIKQLQRRRELLM